MSGLFGIYESYEEELVNSFKDVLREGTYIGGHFIEDFENDIVKFFDCKYAVACKSGTTALMLSLLSSGVKAGDEVITIPDTYYATAYAINAVGAKPVFCDVHADTGLMDSKKLEEKITSKTVAVIPVHLYGIPSDMDVIQEICARNKIHVIEDCSHSFGTKLNGRYLGADSEYACFSLYPTKNFGAFGDGGLVLTNSKSNYEKMKRLRYFAINPAHNRFNINGLHARCDSIQAALMSVSLKHFEEIIERKNEIRKFYSKNLTRKVIRIMPDDKNIVPYVYPILVDNRQAYLNYLKKYGINLPIHFEVNLNELEEFKDLSEEFEFSKKHNEMVVSLPILPCTDNEYITRLVDLTNVYFKTLKESEV